MKNQQAIENFLGTLDKTQPLRNHLLNAKRDAFLYKWDDKTLTEIIEGIIDEYKKQLHVEN